MFQWVDSIARTVGHLFPRLEVISVTDRGVLFYPWGERVMEIGRWCIWWPVINEFYSYNCKRQNLDPPIIQLLTTKDNKKVHLHTIVIYEISDVVKAHVETNDFYATIREISAGTVAEHFMKLMYSEARDQVAEGDAPKTFKREIQKSVNKYGVKVLDVRFGEFATTPSVRLISGSMEPIIEQGG